LPPASALSPSGRGNPSCLGGGPYVQQAAWPGSLHKETGLNLSTSRLQLRAPRLETKTFREPSVGACLYHPAKVTSEHDPTAVNPPRTAILRAPRWRHSPATYLQPSRSPTGIALFGRRCSLADHLLEGKSHRGCTLGHIWASSGSFYAPSLAARVIPATFIRALKDWT
jgi:hypothetical protein